MNSFSLSTSTCCLWRSSIIAKAANEDIVIAAAAAVHKVDSTPNVTRIYVNNTLNGAKRRGDTLFPEESSVLKAKKKTRKNIYIRRLIFAITRWFASSVGGFRADFQETGNPAAEFNPVNFPREFPLHNHSIISMNPTPPRPLPYLSYLHAPPLAGLVSQC